MDDLVSIIMPSYNTARFIGQSIESVLAQTYTNWELIIVDDCSTDNTSDVVNGFDDKRIRFFKNNENVGAAITRNFALKQTKGRWIAFLDSDDLWHPNKLFKQISFMNDNGYFFSCTSCENIDEESKSLGIVNKSIKHITKRRMLQYCWPSCLTVMYDYNVIGLIQIENLKKNNDYAMWLNAIKKADCFYLDEVLAKYRVRKKSISHDSFSKLIKSHYSLFRIELRKNKFVSFFYTVKNLFYGLIKKLFYRKKI